MSINLEFLNVWISDTRIELIFLNQALTTFRRTSAASILGRFFKNRNVYVICCADVMPLISIVKATSATHGTRDDRGAVHSRKEKSAEQPVRLGPKKKR